MKILDGVLYHRMLPIVEPQLDQRQFAYRRSRGTEMVSAEMVDLAHRPLNRGLHVYMVSFDVPGAFDRVPLHGLMTAMDRFNIDPYIRRVEHNWLRNRTFQVRLRANGGVYKSKVHTVTCGLPQGGVLSPLLWLMFFNGATGQLGTNQRGVVEAGDSSGSFFSADDITTLITASMRERLGELARQHYA